MGGGAQALGSVHHRYREVNSVCQVAKLFLCMVCVPLLCRVWQVLAQAAATERRIFAVLAHRRLLVVPKEQQLWLLNFSIMAYRCSPVVKLERHATTGPAVPSATVKL